MGWLNREDGSVTIEVEVVINTYGARQRIPVTFSGGKVNRATVRDGNVLTIELDATLSLTPAALIVKGG